ncbi:MAG TPA: biopolymer transporter ExbD [Kiritimatiellia bacterium]|nr:biopolymer transporter ExbD [Kiritimatiellia bacterium]
MAGVNMTPMIDVVFQLIIFFVCTIEMDRQALDESIRLAMAPHGAPVEQKDPREVTIEVDSQGRIFVARNQMTEAFLRQQLRKVVSDHGPTTPIVIRGDGRTRHEDIRRVMDAASYAGLWKISFKAVQDPAQ